MVKNSIVKVKFIEQTKVTEGEHEEQHILAEEFPFYPAYNAGQIIYLEIIDKMVPEIGSKNKAFMIVDVTHAIRQYQREVGRNSVEYTTYPTVCVFLRKII